MTQWHQRDRSPITEEKLARAVHILADIVGDNGSVFRPLYLDLRQQLAEHRLQDQAEAAAEAIAIQAKTRVA